MCRTVPCVALALACFFTVQPLRAQNAIIRTSRLPDHAVRVVTPFGQTAKDTLSTDDYPEMRRLPTSIQRR